MSDLSESLFLRSLKHEPVERTPVWVMRQAGRYLPEYLAVRKEAGDFMTLCRTPKLACEVTLQPLRRFDLDAAILFSDILTIPDAMGLGLSFQEGEGPQFARPIRSVSEVDSLRVTKASDDLAYVMEAAALIRSKMPDDLPLIGFSGSPWTLACYMIEGRGSRDFKHILRFMYEHPEAMHTLLQKLTDSVIDYLNEQVQAGVNALMVFDTWGGILTTPNFEAFSCAYLNQITTRLKALYPDIPIILFTKGGGQWLSALADTGCDGLGVDWTCDLGRARAEVGVRVALQGNLDPAVLLTSPNCIRAEVARVLEVYGTGSGHIFNLGHGITPDVPPEHLEVMIKAVRELSPAYHD
ncbi:MAG: uroporphyrinogen decarboxylase [Gammaproteobacteria bacterium]|nr:uroporphyrinogen decarboxylase [Gammaproteobacteria bacterium]